MSPVTDDEAHAMYQFIEIDQIPCQEWPDRHRIWISHEHQRFMLGFVADNREQAMWMRHQLARCLARMMKVANAGQ